ncbi:type IV secretion system protein [Bartonella harrusi]|uniref:Conjugal transfer protein n=1 Tax=Bartonella harrusi TaxID=2961895 RepID=A0ABY5ESC1_9HYPH|nr:type IV secretion system protein [Bartonella harrusi]UTO28306.1 conjugal transfer protein [Bartonella harrusi]
MKKIITTITAITMVVISVTPSFAIFLWGAGSADLKAGVPALPGSFFKKNSPPKKTPPKPPIVIPSLTQKLLTELIDLTKQRLEQNKEQLEQTKKTNQFITGNRNFAAENFKTMQTDLGSFFLKDPQLIYKINNHPTISASLKGILQEEEIPITVRESRNSIKKRTQYAAVIDKAVSLQTFQETENRFKQISGLLKKIDTTTDLKGIAELQAGIKGMLAMIKNEATKLQMVAYSRNAEQTLIKQQKQKRNMKILNSENKAMPTIRFIR